MSSMRRLIDIIDEMMAEKAMTITGATDSDGEISREKSERILDPQGFFKKAKAPYLKK